MSMRGPQTARTVPVTSPLRIPSRSVSFSSLPTTGAGTSTKSPSKLRKTRLPPFAVPYSYSSSLCTSSDCQLFSEPSAARSGATFDSGPFPSWDEPPDFDAVDINVEIQEHEIPRLRQIYEASLLPVLSETGESVQFGSLFEDSVVAVCFIRHFWCPLCQDYMKTIVKHACPDALAQSGVKLVIIGNGSPAMVNAYREKLFHCPYPIYTDPTRRIFRAMGMWKCTTDGGPGHAKGNYVKHGLVGGIGMVVKNAFKMLPLPVNVLVSQGGAGGGDIGQLGGEFVLGPGLRCGFAHRMTTTRSHAPIRAVLRAAGVDLDRVPAWLTPLPSARRQRLDSDPMVRIAGNEDLHTLEMWLSMQPAYQGTPNSPSTSTQRSPVASPRPGFLSSPPDPYPLADRWIDLDHEQERDWMEKRNEALKSIRQKKVDRRGGGHWVAYQPGFDSGSLEGNQLDTHPSICVVDGVNYCEFGSAYPS